MAELKERPLKTLSALSQMTEPVRPSDIANITRERPIDVGRDFSELLKAGLAAKVDEEQNLWAITDDGRNYLDSVAERISSQPLVTEPVTGIKTCTSETSATVPSQSDLFRC